MNNYYLDTFGTDNSDDICNLLIGYHNQERCPACGKRLWINKNGDEWCGNEDCFWPEFKFIL